MWSESIAIFNPYEAILPKSEDKETEKKMKKKGFVAKLLHFLFGLR